MTPQQLIDEISRLPEEAQRQVGDYVEFLRQKHHLARSVEQSHTADLAAEPFIGMWRGRQDLEDSTAWVRDARRKEW